MEKINTNRKDDCFLRSIYADSFIKSIYALDTLKSVRQKFTTMMRYSNQDQDQDYAISDLKSIQSQLSVVSQLIEHINYDTSEHIKMLEKSKEINS